MKRNSSARLNWSGCRWGVARSSHFLPRAPPNEQYEPAIRLAGPAHDLVGANAVGAREDDRRPPSVGNYAKETLPTLRKHLETAQSLNGTTSTANLPAKSPAVIAVPSTRGRRSRTRTW